MIIFACRSTEVLVHPTFFVICISTAAGSSVAIVFSTLRFIGHAGVTCASNTVHITSIGTRLTSYTARCCLLARSAVQCGWARLALGINRVRTVLVAILRFPAMVVRRAPHAVVPCHPPTRITVVPAGVTTCAFRASTPTTGFTGAVAVFACVCGPIMTVLATRTLAFTECVPIHRIAGDTLVALSLD